MIRPIYDTKTLSHIVLDIASPFWSPVGNGESRILFGKGETICSHDFRVREEADWARSFLPETLEVCLNLAGGAEIERGGCQMRFTDATIRYFVIAGKTVPTNPVAPGAPGGSTTNSSRCASPSIRFANSLNPISTS